MFMTGLLSLVMGLHFNPCAFGYIGARGQRPEPGCASKPAAINNRPKCQSHHQVWATVTVDARIAHIWAHHGWRRHQRSTAQIGGYAPLRAPAGRPRSAVGLRRGCRWRIGIASVCAGVAAARYRRGR
jgi:hypothetical protein